MATLTDAERREIVQRLATYETPAEVAKWASEAFEKDVPVNQVAHYDPNRSQDTGKRWVELFDETRKTFNRDASRVAIAQKMYRLRRLQEIAEDPAVETRERLRAFEQAAKEMGEAYTNSQKLEHTGEGGRPLTIVFDADVPEPDDV